MKNNTTKKECISNLNSRKNSSQRIYFKDLPYKMIQHQPCKIANTQKAVKNTQTVHPTNVAEPALPERVQCDYRIRLHNAIFFALFKHISIPKHKKQE
jgi:hypothetical protein